MTAVTYSYEIDGTPVETDDPVLTGRDVRSQAGLTPASDHVLIEIGERSTRSIGLEERIDLCEGRVPEMRSFPSDRVYSLTVNERGFEWGTEQISAIDIRRYGRIPDDHELILDSKGDRPIADDDIVHLNEITKKNRGADFFPLIFGKHFRTVEVKDDRVILTP